MNSEKRQLLGLLKLGRVEVRAFIGDKTVSGVFDDYRYLSESLKQLMESNADIYNTLNPVDLEVTNGISTAIRTSRDSDISRITRIPFDFDPIRETGIAATGRQIDDSEVVAERLIRRLNQYAWPDPLMGISGNGCHLIYDTDLPNDKETKKTLTNLYKALEIRFTTDKVKFDVVVRNPARIFRTYGTVNQKGGRKTFCVAPENSYVPGDKIVDLASSLTPEKKKRTWVKTEGSDNNARYIKGWDIVGVFNQSGMVIKERGDVVDVVCPWEAAHSSTSETDAGVWAGEWPQFHCFHDSCSDKDIKDVLAFFGVTG